MIFAQPLDISLWNNLRNSSYDSNNNLNVRFETIEIEDFPVEQHLYYLDNNQWIESEINHFAELSYQSEIPYLEGQTNKYRMSAVMDTLVFMMPAHITDAMPTNSNLLAAGAPDPTGDVISPSSIYNDFTGQFFAYSENKLYSGLTNTENSFPLNNGGWLPDEYYFYLTGFINPENILADSVAYAMVHAQVGIPGIVGIESGLYKINNFSTEISLDNFEQIGDIQTDVIDDMLVMQCDFADITDDPEFGEWPSASRSLAAVSMTGFLNLSGTINIPDMSYPTALNINQGIIEPFTNSLPQLSNDIVDLSGYLPLVSVDYFDENSNFPLTAKITLDNGNEMEMIPSSFDFSQPVTFQVATTATWENATISFSDNNIDFVELEITLTSSEYEATQLQITQLNNYPNPFNPSTTINFYLQNDADVSLEICNVKGQTVQTIVRNHLNKGKHEFVWNGRNDANEGVSSGIYFIKLRANNDFKKKKIILLK